jgi:hypothetical protein
MQIPLKRSISTQFFHHLSLHDMSRNMTDEQPWALLGNQHHRVGWTRETHDMWVRLPRKGRKGGKTVVSGGSGHLLSVMKRIVEWN